MTIDILIIGAGLSGLTAARHLSRQGKHVLLVDSADRIGGRIKTDYVDGFLLDHGFQVYLTAYETAGRELDTRSLNLGPFQAGANVRLGNRWSTVVDPLRESGWSIVSGAFQTALSPVATIADKIRLGNWKRASAQRSVQEILARRGTTSRDYLRELGFSERIIERFFRPFFGGVFLDPELTTDASRMEFVFRSFSLGHAALPRDGMQAIPEQIASHLSSDLLRLSTTVSRVETGVASLSDGSQILARQIIVATERPTAFRLLGAIDPVRVASHRSTVCFYFAVPQPPTRRPLLMLNGNRDGLINHVAFPSLAQPNYAPEGWTLASVNTVGLTQQFGIAAIDDVVRELEHWFGWSVRTWRHLRTYRIPYALPDQSTSSLNNTTEGLRLPDGIHLCGDHRATGSIEGAIQSGITVAREVIAKDAT